MLSIAELSRRGLLLPEKLKEFFPLLKRALIYEKNEGTHCVGANIRDAACFVVWAFARAYDPSVLKPYVLDLSRDLLTVCVFDKNI